MSKKRKEFKGIHFTKNKNADFSTISDAIPVLMKKGVHKELWQSPQFIQANQLSQYLVQSATLLKKHLPKKFHELVRFTQSPNTWVLSVNDKDTATQLSTILSDNYQSLQGKEELPQFLRLRRAYRYWEQSGELLCDMADFSKQAPIKRLANIIPNALQHQIRIQYQPSVWQLNVPNAGVSTRLKPLLDELSLLIAREMGFAPKLKLTVVPSEWEKSGFMLVEIVKEHRKIPSEDEADKFLAEFLQSQQASNQQSANSKA